MPRILGWLLLMHSLKWLSHQVLSHRKYYLIANVRSTNIGTKGIAGIGAGGTAAIGAAGTGGAGTTDAGDTTGAAAAA